MSADRLSPDAAATYASQASYKVKSLCRVCCLCDCDRIGIVLKNNLSAWPTMLSILLVGLGVLGLTLSAVYSVFSADKNLAKIPAGRLPCSNESEPVLTYVSPNQDLRDFQSLAISISFQRRVHIDCKSRIRGIEACSHISDL